MAIVNHPASTKPATLLEIAHGGLRGTIAAMAMTGMRDVTTGMGLVGETPPTAIVRQRAKAMIRRVPRKRQRAAIELFHWAYGTAGGAVFAALPAPVRQAGWAGPVYGLVVWVGFEAGVAPVLGLDQARRRRSVERLAFAVDHLLYGFVLSETRRRPQS